ncbi:MAG: DUF4254 domain-containing protein [Elusimicrobiota bacterium]
MAETIGSLVDKISIMGLKIHYMGLQIDRKDATEAHRQACSQKSEILKIQQKDLSEELTQLFQDVLSGQKQLKVYRQFKMYNDPNYRAKQTA